MGKLNEYAPKLPFLPLDTSYVCSDPEVAKSYDNDELVYHGWMRVRFFNEFLRTSAKVLGYLFHVKPPLLILQGTGATLINSEGANQLYNEAASQDKTLKMYDGLFYQLFEEKDKEKVMLDTINWLNNRIGK